MTINEAIVKICNIANITIGDNGVWDFSKCKYSVEETKAIVDAMIKGNFTVETALAKIEVLKEGKVEEFILVGAPEWLTLGSEPVKGKYTIKAYYSYNYGSTYDIYISNNKDIRFGYTCHDSESDGSDLAVNYTESYENPNEISGVNEIMSYRLNKQKNIFKFNMKTPIDMLWRDLPNIDLVVEIK